MSVADQLRKEGEKKGNGGLKSSGEKNIIT